MRSRFRTGFYDRRARELPEGPLREPTSPMLTRAARSALNVGAPRAPSTEALRSVLEKVGRAAHPRGLGPGAPPQTPRVRSHTMQRTRIAKALKSRRIY